MNKPGSSVYRKLGDEFAKQLQETLSASLNRSVGASAGETQPCTTDLLQMEFPTGIVSGTSYGDGIPGELSFWLPPEGVAAIVDLLVMGDGSATFNPEEHLDGIAETLRPVVNQLEQSWERAGLPIRMEPLSAEMHEEADVYGAAYLQNTLMRIDLSIEGFGEIGMWVYVSPELVSLLQPPPRQEPRAPRASAPNGHDANGMNVRPAVFAPFDSSREAEPEPRNLELLMDVPLPITIELGRTSMLIKDVLDLGPGSVIELDKLSGEPVDIYVNERKFARGEVVVIDENFGVRITELLRVDERIKQLRP